MVTFRRPFRTNHDPEQDAAAVLEPAAKAEIRARVMEGVAGVELEPKPFYTAGKRVLDIIIAMAGLIATLPLTLAIALLIKLDSPGPVFFRQERLGRGLKHFSMLKFRSMYTDKTEVPPELLLKNESSGPLFKMRRDPRVTRVGRWLRRTSLDELPQLINILRGEMSVVGPRPPLPRELEGFDTVQRLRLRVTPGLTGLWQVSGRSNLKFDEMVQLDMSYIENRSLWLDLKIMLKTVPSVIFAKGAF
ncbi:MAG TPA: sugar transferase [Dehalococcoidia bacterium]|nr:sugar transferase [Dehalococcoidia bacterium]